MMLPLPISSSFFNDTPTTMIYTLSLHDALPIFGLDVSDFWGTVNNVRDQQERSSQSLTKKGVKLVSISANDLYLKRDRKSTRLNSSHVEISYAVFCLKKKNIKQIEATALLRRS